MGPAEIKSKLLKALRAPLEQRKLNAADCGQRLRDDKFLERIDQERGEWKDDWGTDPGRWLLRIVPDSGNGFAIAPLSAYGDRLGVVNTAAKVPVAAALVRIGVFVATGPDKYKLEPEWIWFLWFVLKQPLSDALGTSARISRFSPGERKVTFNKTTVDFLDCGLVGVLPETATTTTSGFAQPLSYGEVTKRLAEFIDSGAANTDAAPGEADGSQPGEAGVARA